MCKGKNILGKLLAVSALAGGAILLISKLKKDINNCEIFGVGVYTEKVIIQEFFTKPVKKLEERLDAVKKIDGVDFVFVLDTNDPKEIKKIVQEEAMKYINKK